MLRRAALHLLYPVPFFLNALLYKGRSLLNMAKLAFFLSYLLIFSTCAL
jgi:hypothetical protein